MANRRDAHLALPRRWKRQMALMDFPDAHQRGVFRRLMIAAHQHAQAMHKKMLTQQDNVDQSTVVDKEVPATEQPQKIKEKSDASWS